MTKIVRYTSTSPLGKLFVEEMPPNIESITIRGTYSQTAIMLPITIYFTMRSNYGAKFVEDPEAQIMVALGASICSIIPMATDPDGDDIIITFKEAPGFL